MKGDTPMQKRWMQFLSLAGALVVAAPLLAQAKGRRQPDRTDTDVNTPSSTRSDSDANTSGSSGAAERDRSMQSGDSSDASANTSRNEDTDDSRLYKGNPGPSGAGTTQTSGGGAY